MAHRAAVFDMIERFNSINRKPTMATAKLYPHAPGKGPQTNAKREFAGLLLDYHRRAGEPAARALMECMSVDGLDRGHLLAIVRDALNALPVLH